MAKKKKKTAKRSARPKRKPPKRKLKKRAAPARSRPSRLKKARSRKKRPAARPRERGSRLRELELPTQSRRAAAASESAGQSGDTQGLSASEMADAESVEELVEEGQSFEASVVAGVENAPDADEHEVRTRELPEDDIPDEYRDSRENR